MSDSESEAENPFEILAEAPGPSETPSHEPATELATEQAADPGVEPVLLSEIEAENPFETADPSVDQNFDAVLPAEFETPGVAAAIESATPAYTLSEELIESEIPVVREVSDPTSHSPMTAVREFADQAGIAAIKSEVPASFPFSLLIEGKFGDYERAKFLDIFSRENLGFREIDLEAQLESGRVLIPRISEYAGVLLVQELRSLPLKMRLGPSAEIYQKGEAMDEETAGSARPASVSHTWAEPEVDVLTLPITTEAGLPQFVSLEVIDTVTASATLKAQTVEPKTSDPAFQRTLENLQRDLRIAAHRKGARAIIHFKTELTPLSHASHYRLIATGVAVRADATLGANPYALENPQTSTDMSSERGAPLSEDAPQFS